MGGTEPLEAPVEVVNNSAERRFEISEGGQLATLDYAQRNGKLYLIHTEVPKALEGRGYAGALARTALDYARHEQLRVVPWCPFIRAYLVRHPEDASLVEHE